MSVNEGAGAGKLHPTMIRTGNFIRTHPDGPWKKVLSVRDGQIQVGRQGRSGTPLGPPSITPSQLEPSVVFDLEGGEEINQPTVEELSAKTQKVPANEVGTGDVIQNPENDAWVSVTKILDGELGRKHADGHDKSGTHFFTGDDFEGAEHNFDSYLTTAYSDPAVPPRNEVIVRVVRE